MDILNTQSSVKLSVVWLHSVMSTDWHPDKNIEYRIARLIEAYQELKTKTEAP